MGATIDLTNIRLPSLPAAAVKVIELVQDPDVDVQSLGRVIEYDPALATRLVRLANSSLFGLTREITTVRQALVILGLRTVKLAALSFTLLDSFGSGVRSAAMTQCWRRILTNAMACRLLGPLFEFDAEEAFLAGLMKDLGLLVCAQSLGPKYIEIVERSERENEPDVGELELQEFGLTHVEVSVQLMGQWRLPSRLAAAIQESGRVDLKEAFESHHRDLNVLLATGEAITNFLLKPSVDHLDKFMLVSDAFGESSSEVDKFVQKLEMQVGEMAELLDLNLKDGIEYEAILKRARELSKDLRVENREQLPLRVRQELAKAKREKFSLAMVLLRMTTVSQLMKAGRSEVADLLQQTISRRLQELTRECDALFRLNLSTYSIITTHTGMEGLETLVQRLLPELSAVSVECEGEVFRSKMAFGVVLREGQSTSDVTVEAFLLKANDNLSDAIVSEQFVAYTVF